MDELKEVLDQLIERLEPIAIKAERPAWLDCEHGFDECLTYCWDCAMEEIDWTRWQMRLCLWAAFDYGNSHGWKLAQFIWEKGNDLQWWIEGGWVWAGTEEEYYSSEFYEVLPNSTSLESDGIQVCECCGKVLDQFLTEFGVREELRGWCNHPPQFPLPQNEARYLEILLASITETGIESCDRKKLDSLVKNLQTLLGNNNGTTQI